MTFITYCEILSDRKSYDIVQAPAFYIICTFISVHSVFVKNFNSL